MPYAILKSEDGTSPSVSCPSIKQKPMDELNKGKVRRLGWCSDERTCLPYTFDMLNLTSHHGGSAGSCLASTIFLLVHRFSFFQVSI